MITSSLICATAFSLAAPETELQVETDFPGGSAIVNVIDSTKRIVSVKPTAHKDRGWVCWWYFKLNGVKPGETLTLSVTGSGFTRPTHASMSLDNKTWIQTPAGKTEGNTVTYSVPIPETSGMSVWFAWGPPYQLADAHAAVETVVAADVGAKAFTLCRSLDGHEVPAVRWDPPKQGTERRPGLWIQARQHAWESGGSWVCQGFLDFLVSDDADAKRLRESARIVVVPVMDVDNIERGAGGKNRVPHDHNRDWSDDPVWPEVAAAQKGILALNADNEFDLFLDLHNPAPGDRVPFFFVPPETQLPVTRQANMERFLRLAGEHLGREPLKLTAKPRTSGANYDKNWKRISKNWVADHTHERAIALTLETSWNTPHSTIQGYRAYGRALGKTLAEYILLQDAR